MNHATPDDWEKLKGKKSKKTRSKHGVRMDEEGIAARAYKGVVYDSRLERDYAEHLDFGIRARQIVCWQRQIGIKLLGHDGTLVCRYYADFLVMRPNGEKSYHEVKGRETDVWILKKKLFHATKSPETSYPLIVVTKPKDKPWTLTPSRPSSMA